MIHLCMMQVNVNLAGLPALVLPCGFAEAGQSSLPVGFQMIGAAFDEVGVIFLNIGFSVYIVFELFGTNFHPCSLHECWSLMFILASLLVLFSLMSDIKR